jgi:AsmA protein
MSGKFNMAQGVAEVEEGAMRGSQIALYFSGRANVAERSVDVHASANRAGSDGKALQFGFSIAGPWDDPALVPDAEGLIRRSDAAAPLMPSSAPPAAPPPAAAPQN